MSNRKNIVKLLSTVDLAKLVSIDEGYSFDEIVEIVGQVSENVSEANELLQIIIAAKFKNRIIREAMEKKKTVAVPDRLAAFIPKKKRDSRTRVDILTQPNSFLANININVSPRKHYSQENQKMKPKRVSRMRRCEEKKSKNLKKAKKTDLGPPPDMPVELRKKIETKGGNEIKLVIMKKVFETDLSKGHDRLSIPVNQVRDASFLKDKEKNRLENGTVDVKLMEPCGHESDMKLRKWVMNTASYVLTSSWNAVVHRRENKHLHIFEKDNIIQVWSFRINQQLWFTINKVIRYGGDDDDDHNDAAGSCIGGGEATMVLPKQE